VHTVNILYTAPTAFITDSASVRKFTAVQVFYRLLAHIIIRLEAIASAEYWIHFRARFGDVHAFGFNSAESEPIGVKCGAI